MVKNRMKIVVAALLCAGSLFAGTAGGGSDGRLFNTAYFDVTLKSQNPMLDYIKYSKRGSFDIEQYLSTVNKIGEKWITVNIQGRIIVPSDIKTKQVYVSVGKAEYAYDDGNGGKWIYYNGSKQYQNSEYFAVDTKKDIFGERYVDFNIKLTHRWGKDVQGNWHQTPKNIIFHMAPKKRGFKNKFEKCDIYVLDE
jgi:hypothetical protein